MESIEGEALLLTSGIWVKVWTRQRLDAHYTSHWVFLTWSPLSCSPLLFRGALTFWLDCRRHPKTRIDLPCRQHAICNLQSADADELRNFDRKPLDLQCLSLMLKHVKFATHLTTQVSKALKLLRQLTLPYGPSPRFGFAQHSHYNASNGIIHNTLLCLLFCTWKFMVPINRWLTAFC